MARPQRAKQPPDRLEDTSIPPRVRAQGRTRAATKAAAPTKVYDDEVLSDVLSSSSSEDDDYDADAEMESKRAGRSRYVKVYRHHHYSLRHHEGRGFYHLVGPHGIPKYLVKLPDHKPTIIPSIDIQLIRDVLERPERLPTVDILHWLKSNDVLPIVKRWTVEIYNSHQIHGLMLFAFRYETYPWLSRRQYALLRTMRQESDDTTNPHIGLLAKYASLLVANNRLWFEKNFSKYELEVEDKHRLAISALLVAWTDLQTKPDVGFFALLLDSPLATPKYAYSRKILDMWFIVDERAIPPHGADGIEHVTAQQIRRDLLQDQRQSADVPRPLALEAKHKKLAVSIGETKAVKVWKPTDTEACEMDDGLKLFKMISDLHGSVQKHRIQLREANTELQRAQVELEMLRVALQSCTCQHKDEDLRACARLEFPVSECTQVYA